MQTTSPSPYVRTEERIRVGGQGTLTWDGGRGSRQCRARVRNLSDNGLQLHLDRPLAPGWTAYLTGDTFECLGRVIYCRPAESGFLVGINLRREPYLRNTINRPV